MEFDFNRQLFAMNQLEIPEMGSCAIQASNDNGYCYYLVIKTFIGQTVVATCGPILPDIEQIPSGFTVSLTRQSFSEDKLFKLISAFLNDKYHAITDAKVIEFDEAINNFRDLKDYLLTISEETI